MLTFKLTISNNDTTSICIYIYHVQMEFISSIIQEFCTYLNIKNLYTIAYFQQDFLYIKQLLQEINQHHLAKNNLNINIAEQNQYIKYLIMKVEDYRILNNFQI